jgi:WD40 repeat protein
MSIATLAPVNIFGIRSDVNDNVCFLDEQNVIYPAGANIVLYNTDLKTQRFISAGEGAGKFTAMAVSPNRRYIAVAEKADKPCVVVYDLQTLKKKKVGVQASGLMVQALQLADDDTQTQEFVAMAFAPDSKYLVTVGSTPDCMLHFWMWEKSRGPIASYKCASQVRC